MNTSRAAVFFLFASSALACHAADDRGSDAGAAPRVDLYLTLCDGRSFCEEMIPQRGEYFLDGHVELADCLPGDTAVLVGSWSVEDAAAHPFEWQLEARHGGVFAFKRHTAANLFCGNAHRQVHSPDLALAADPDGFAWARLEGDDVFVPFQGKATFEHDFRATAVFETVDSSATPRATITVEGPDASPSAHPFMGPGDIFRWGSRRATVVRIVAPQSELLGVVGWVEVRLSEEHDEGSR